MEDWFYAWLAGLIDGDGAFIIGINNCKTTLINYYPIPRISISIQSTEPGKKTMEFIHKNLGYGTYYTLNSDVKGCMEYVILKGQTCYNLCIELYPYLVLKKETCKIFFDVLERMRKGEHLEKEGFLKICALREDLNRYSKHQNLKKDVNWYKENLVIKEVQDKSEKTKRSWKTRREKYGVTGFTEAGYAQTRRHLTWNKKSLD